MKKQDIGMSMIDISRFMEESKQERRYFDQAIKTENYALVKRELYEKLIANQLQWTATENKLENRIDFSIEYSDLIREDDIIEIIAEKIAESRKME